MEAFYLLCTILSTCLTSFTLSLLLPFRLLLRRITHAPPTAGVNAVSPYQGTVWHERRRPVHHSFKYSVRYALIDLDHGQLYTPPDHLSPQEARDIAQTNGPVFLLTIPPSVGYEQNPLSVYYCYDMDGSSQCLKKCIAEVTNTPWGERVQFLFNPNSDTVAKPLHVSPFMDMLGSWSIRANTPGDHLFINISVEHPKLGDYFTASLTASRASSADHALFFWLMPHKVALWIYWHALKLWWKKVQFIQHPRYGNPGYKQDAMIHDRNLQCCQAFAVEANKHQQVERSSDPNFIYDTNRKDRWFRWRDAKWPWC